MRRNDGGHGGVWKNLRNGWFGSHATQMNRSVKKARLSATLSLTRDGDYASTGVEGVVHHFIAEASQNIHRLRFSPPENSTASLIGKRTTVDEERKRKRERERDRRGRDI